MACPAIRVAESEGRPLPLNRAAVSVVSRAAAPATATDSPVMRIVLKMPAAAPAFSTGTVLTAALSMTSNARPTPAPKGSRGRPPPGAI
jgi:hypothetical protein